MRFSNLNDFSYTSCFFKKRRPRISGLTFYSWFFAPLSPKKIKWTYTIIVVYRIRYGGVSNGYTMYNIIAEEDDSHGDGQTNFYEGGDVGDGYIIRRVQLYLYIYMQ